MLAASRRVGAVGYRGALEEVFLLDRVLRAGHEGGLGLMGVFAGCGETTDRIPGYGLR